MDAAPSIPSSSRGCNIWLCADLPVTDYKEAHALQLRLAAARRAGLLESDALLLLEHAPVLTLGARGGLESLSVRLEHLKERGVALIQAERGGNITYHGPGQLVGYPIVNLRAAGISVSAYVERLEEVMIRTALSFGVRAERNALNRGVWVGRNKIGSIGIAIRGGIAFHGFALNASVCLEPFEWINPCGLKGIGVTSLERELSVAPSRDAVAIEIKRHVEALFHVRLKPTDAALLEALSCSHISMERK